MAKLLTYAGVTREEKTLDHLLYMLCKDLKQKNNTDRGKLTESPEVVSSAEEQ
jgi:thioredoxin-like negative regulator of GroEL